MYIPRSSSPKKGKKVLENLYYFPENQMLDCNQYIIVDPESGEIALFDTGNGANLSGLFEGMKILKLDYKNIRKVFLTHEHVDHVLGLYPLTKALKNEPIEIFAYGETAKVLSDGNESKIFPGDWGISPSMFGVQIEPLKVTNLNGLQEIQIFPEFNFQIYYTPGHSLGSVCYYEQTKKILISGDLIFTGGSIGRFDFPQSSLSSLQKSIKFITNNLDVKYLLPGHMSITDDGNRHIQLSHRYAQSISNLY